MGSQNTKNLKESEDIDMDEYMKNFINVNANKKKNDTKSKLNFGI